MSAQTGSVHGTVVTANGVYNHARIDFEDGIITAIQEEPNSSDITWIPGFIDLHNHGGNRGAFPTGTYDECVTAAQFHRSNGTTTMLASMVSGSCDELSRQAEVLAKLTHAGLVAGIHMEGPFISSCKCGAQDPSRIVQGDPDFFQKVIDAADGTLRSITFAPETENADEIMQLCAKHNIIASLGHTEADFKTTTAIINRGLELGTTVTATHLFNAMPPLHHREPGAAGALIAAAKRGDAYVEMVADDVHLHAGTVDAAYNPNAFAITDAVEAAGMPDGQYRLGQLNVTVIDGVARVDTGAIAGGTSTLLQQFLRFSSRHDAAKAARFTSTTAARVLGDDSIGDIAVGRRMNAVGIAKGRLVSVLVDGHEIY